jgi:hypothetical protein
MENVKSKIKNFKKLLAQNYSSLTKFSKLYEVYKSIKSVTENNYKADTKILKENFQTVSNLEELLIRLRILKFTINTNVVSQNDLKEIDDLYTIGKRALSNFYEDMESSVKEDVCSSSLIAKIKSVLPKKPKIRHLAGIQDDNLIFRQIFTVKNLKNNGFTFDYYSIVVTKMADDLFIRVLLDKRPKSIDDELGNKITNDDECIDFIKKQLISDGITQKG